MKSASQYSSIKRVIEHMVANKLASPSLEELATALGVTPGHLQKVFTEWVGISPKQFGRYLSLEYSKELLRQNKSGLQASARAGLSGGSRLHDLFVDIEAMTPGEYKSGGSGLSIRYSTFDTFFGICLVASTDRGVCAVLFSDSAEGALADLHSRWPKAAFEEKAQPSHAEVKGYLAGIRPTAKVKLHLQSTNFQIKVWEALLSIPEGDISTYGKVAEILGDAKLSRAVGMAVGNNPVGYIIPCHRVLRSTGEISGYRWSVERKRAMLAREAARSENQ